MILTLLDTMEETLMSSSAPVNEADTPIDASETAESGSNAAAKRKPKQPKRPPKAKGMKPICISKENMIIIKT